MFKTNLESYLDYYMTLKNPGFAVLVTGEWGSGKSHQVNKAIPLELQCKVSLFGINNTEEIYNTVFSKMYPGKHFAKKMIELTKDVTSEFSGVTLGAGSIIGGMITPLIKQTVDKDKVIIFDDLERCAIPNSEILGVINQYVEHHQCRVVILAHDKKTHTDFITTKEKIIGHTIKIDPQTDEAAASFFTYNRNLNRFTYLKSLIVDAFKKTECKSLRILKCVINDCNRLLSCLEPVHIKNTLAIQALFNYFCILNIEFRQGHLNVSDIENMPKDYSQLIMLTQTNDNESDDIKNSKKNLRALHKKYNEIEVRNRTIGNELLALMLETGKYPKKEIVESLNFSKFFIKNQKHPAWTIIINYDHLESDVVRNAIDEMFKDLKEFTVVEIQDIMHTFCLSYLLSDYKEIPQSFEELYSQQVEYIDNLLIKGLLPPEELRFNPFADKIYSRAKSYTYWIKDSYKPYVNEIIEHIKKSRKISQINKYPDYAKDILQALDTDLNRFNYLLLGDSKEAGIYSNIDILNTIPPEDFVLHWLILPVDSWERVYNILISRYSTASQTILNQEKDWLYEVCLNLHFEAQLNKGIDRARITRIFPYSIFQP